jgi:hypothetical protein
MGGCSDLIYTEISCSTIDFGRHALYILLVLLHGKAVVHVAIGPPVLELQHRFIIAVSLPKPCVVRVCLV